MKRSVGDDVGPTRAPAALERSLSRAAYVDAAFFERERDAIFWNQWFLAARSEQFGAVGAYRTVDVAGESVIIVRGGAGLAAHLNLCRHRGSRLLCGNGTLRGTIVCPYHAWSYAHDGALIAAPFVDRSALPDDTLRLHPVAVAEWGGFVFVHLNPDAVRQTGSTLERQLGAARARVARYPLAELRTAHSIVYDIAANWKVLLENYNECYHCAGVHPELCRIVPAFKHNGGAGLDWENGIPHAPGARTFTRDGTTTRAAFAGLDAFERERHKGELIYPNFMLSLSADHIAAFTLWPQAPGRTTVVCDFLFAPEEIALPDFDPSDAIEFWDLVNRQDWRICEGVQAGMQSRAFQSGYYAPLEDASLDIRRYLAERLGPQGVSVPQAYDAIVLGLGGIGSGAAYWLAKRGARVLGLEQFAFGHALGESHDHSRIIRLSYHTPDYVRLARAAYAAWAALEADSGETLVTRTGGLDLGPRDGAIPLAAYAASMRACGVPFDELDAREIRRRWPFLHIGDDVHGLFQADGGIVAAERATAAHQRAARAFGATLREHAQVTAIADRGGEIQVRAGGQTYRARKLVIAAGPWSARALAAFDTVIPLEVTKEQATYFQPADPAPFALGACPVWIWMDDPSFYGFPNFAGAGVKVAQDAGGKAVDPDRRGFDPDPDITTRLNTFLARRMPALLGTQTLTKTCLYTLTPDRDFVVAALREHPHVCVAIGAGHAFKFASVLGQILSDIALDGGSAQPLDAFALDRPILLQAAPARTYMV